MKKTLIAATLAFGALTAQAADIVADNCVIDTCGDAKVMR